MKKIGMSFGFASVQSGVRNVNAEPELIAVSTEGGFRITPAVSKALDIAAGEYVQFVSNVQAVQEAIDAKAPELVAAVEEAGLAWGSKEANDYIHSACDEFAICKGIQLFDTKGLARKTKERLTVEDKKAFANQNFDAMMAAAMENADDETQEALTREGVTRDEQIEILSQFVEPKELNKYAGAKTANTANMTGVGLSLNFTDSNVWYQLKADLGEEATKKNRVYSINLDEVQEQVLSNGYEDVTVKMLKLGEYKDVEPARISKKNSAE